LVLCVWLCVNGLHVKGQDDTDDVAEPKSDRLYRTAHLACDKTRDDMARQVDEGLTKAAAGGSTTFSAEIPSWFAFCGGNRNIADEVSEILCGNEFHYLILYDPDKLVKREYDGTKGPVMGLAMPFEASIRERRNNTPCSYQVKPKSKASAQMTQPDQPADPKPKKQQRVQ
jgi:hypothetical protein